ncbi:MAG: ATP-dependent DNA helicase, partial [Actinomycetia bacterium]|nr:ATP-dependent DNA helicase [Actinomycetes bacterium]
DEAALELLESADGLRTALDEVVPERVTDPTSPVAAALVRLQAAARAALSGIGTSKDADPERAQAKGALQEVFDTAERMAGLDVHDVLWVSERERFGRQLVVAPLSVSGLVRDVILAETTAVFTSATLTVGGDFTASATGFGLARRSESGEPGPAVPWRGLDVGSPFDYRRQGILYLARRLPVPGRGGLSDEVLAEIAELVAAAGGRTLGLFASHRNAVAAAAYLREQQPTLPVLCQGEAHLAELTGRFAAEPTTSLFGTLSLWQGLDVAGDSCQLVIIDKIPFPRPDEPLLLARQQAVTAAGGNGFMQVAASHAGLLLAQGAGRLIRRLGDRGVVAVLDPRLVTARYGSYLRASMPPFWQTTDPEVARAALRRLTGLTAGAGR